MTFVWRQRLLATPDGYDHSIGRVLAIYGALMAIMFLASLDQTIVATALPNVAADIGGIKNYAWVFGSYLLFQTISVPIYGKLGDVHGRRRMLLSAMLIFLGGSMLCGFAHSMSQLIAFRGVQGIGAGGLVPLIHATIGDLIPPRERGRYQGLMSAAFGSASVLGPAVGGLIVDNTTWRWIFFINVPAGGFALLIAFVTLPRAERAREHSIDYIGGALLAAGTGLLLVGLTWGGAMYPWLSNQVLGVLTGSVLAFGLFVVQEARVRETILPFALLRVSTVTAGVVSIGIAASCMFGAIAFVPLFAQRVIGMSAINSGVVLTPLMLGAVLTSIVSGWWISHTGHYRTNLLVGPIVLGIGMALLSRMGASTSAAEAARNMFISGAGIGLMMSVFITAVQNVVPNRALGSATALLQFSRLLGATLGVTIFGVIINHELPGPSGGLQAVHGVSPVARERLAVAMSPAFAFAACACLVMWFVVFIGVKQHPLRRSVDDQPTAGASL
jgi:EmrB/QacA subfamily drug resistance transporter